MEVSVVLVLRFFLIRWWKVCGMYIFFVVIIISFELWMEIKFVIVRC